MEKINRKAEAKGWKEKDIKYATVQLKDKYYYGSSYRVFFEDGPFVDSVNKTISLVKGDYVFYVNSSFYYLFFICRKE